MTRTRSEWKRTLWGLVGLLLVTGSAATIWIHHVWSHSDRLLEQVVRAHLDRLTPGINVEFSSCRFDLLRRVRFDDVELTTIDGQPLASVPRIVISIDREALAERQQLLIQKVTLHQPHLRLVRDTKGGWNWRDLAPQQDERTMFPEWTIDRGRVEITLLEQYNMKKPKDPNGLSAFNNPTRLSQGRSYTSIEMLSTTLGLCSLL